MAAAMQDTLESIESCPHNGGRFELTLNGVHFIGRDDKGNEKPPQWICSPLRIVAMTRDTKSNEWGRLLEWQDNDGNKHQWPMPMDLLEGDGAEVRRELARMGLQIAPTLSARNYLAAYVKVWPVEARARCTDRLGWHGKAYLLPDRAYQEGGEPIVFQNMHSLEPAFVISGTFDDWRDNIAARALGNSRLVFAISLALAGPLAMLVNEDSGGFHLRGASSIGKSTALQVAASVWGKPASYVRSWLSTANGLEGLAAMHNDGLLILDEIGQIDPSKAGEAAYLLGNGQGKARANRNGLARQSQRWRLLYLSAGEESLLGLMARAGLRASAGQEIRLADIEADAGAGLGLFENLHGSDKPAAFATAIKDDCGQYHGLAGVKWLAHLTVNQTKVPAMAQKIIDDFLAQALSSKATGQSVRVAKRFALAAAAGELASHYQVTGWPQGEAMRAMLACFASWQNNFGECNREDHILFAQARAFIETQGASRFEDLQASNDQRIPNRAGYYRTGENGEREFLVLPEVFRAEICKGHDEKTVKRVLINAGMLRPGKDGQPTQVARLPGLNKSSRVYVIRYRGEEN